MTALTVTHSSTVTEDQIDHLGHMNVRYYATNARSATRAILERLGVPTSEALPVFDTYTRHYNEQLLDDELEVRSGIVSVEDDSIRLYHELANAKSGQLAATFFHRVRLDAALTALVAISEVPAHGATRSIDLSADPVTSAPPLETLRELGLEMRRPREIGDDDCGESDEVAPPMIPHLIWGGETLSGAGMVMHHVGPNGENMGWATMETRIAIGRLPKRGSNIQSFSATTAIANKTSQHVMWAFDVDAGELLVAFEVVSLAFNIDARKSMPIPPDMRRLEESRLHPALAAK